MIRQERGFTLVELLITIAITGLLFSVIGTVLYQMTTISGDGNTQLTMWHELQNVTYRVETDCQSALTASGGSSLTLTYPDSGPVTYSLSGSVLQRISGTEVNILARNITYAHFQVEDRLVTMDITSTVSGRNGRSEQITSMAKMRPAVP